MWPTWWGGGGVRSDSQSETVKATIEHVLVNRWMLNSYYPPRMIFGIFAAFGLFLCFIIFS